MFRLVRLFVICLLAAAVPLKGIAAANMLGCGPGHHRAALQVLQTAHNQASTPEHSQHAAHVAHMANMANMAHAAHAAHIEAQLASPTAHAHAEVKDGLAPVEVGASQGVATDDVAVRAGHAEAGHAKAEHTKSEHSKSEHTKTTQCSSCAPCCAAAAPGASPLRLPEAPPADSRRPVASVMQVFSATAEVPLRPPRAFLA